MSSLQLALAAARAKSTYQSEPIAPPPPPRNQSRYSNRNTSMTRTFAPKQHIHTAETVVSPPVTHNSRTYNMETTNASPNENSKPNNANVRKKLLNFNV